MVAIPNTIKITFKGAIASGERWNCGMTIGFAGAIAAGTVAELNAVAAAAQTAWLATIWKTATPGQLANVAVPTTFTGVDVYQYISAGALAGEGHATTAAVAGTSTTKLAPYSAACVTLVTNQAGPSGRGRMYLPLTGMALTNAELQFGAITNTAESVAALCRALNTTYTLAGVANAGKASVGSLRLGIAIPINSTRCDSVPDTQHGRTRSMVPVSTVTASV